MIPRFLFSAVLSAAMMFAQQQSSQEHPMTPKPSATALGSEKVMAFVASTDRVRAQHFYGDTLGLRLLASDQFALVFDANGIMLRVQIVKDVSVAPYTILGWQVSDIAATAKKLQSAGVAMMRVNGLPQDDLGIWQADAKTKVAWFKDPDGHTLSITQFSD
jgi:catechol 2,3-dioxygenase-like lactoylglutathione lyase family enzyme